MEKMTKEQIQKRQLAIWDRMDVIEETSKKENREFTDAEAKEYEALIRESKALSARAEALASGKALENIREHKSKNAILREFLQKCVETRSNASTILMNPVSGDAGGDNNADANLEAGGAIPLTINELIDTKVAGLELPDSLKMVMGVTGTDIVPYSTNDVKFTVEGEVSQVGEQPLNFANAKATPQRVAASVPVSYRAIDNAAFDIIGFITYKFQKGWAMFRALHVYAHGQYTKLQSPFAKVTPVELTLDQNIGKNLATKIAEMYDLGFEGDPEIIMDKTTEVNLKFTKLIPGTTDSNRTVVQDGQCVGYRYKVSPYIDYAIASNGIASKGADRFIGIGHFGYLNEQVYADGIEFNVDGTSQENFDRNVIALGMGLDYSLVELSSKVNGGLAAPNNGKPQAFKLIKLIQPASSNEIGG